MNELNIQGKIPRQIRKWTCHKFECFTDYISAYAKVVDSARYCYLELYAGCGSCICYNTDCRIDDSELRALKTETKFAKYIFMIRDHQDADNLKRLVVPFNADNSVGVIMGNCIEEKAICQICDLIPRSASSFALIDPPEYRRMRWSTIKKLAAHGNDWRGKKMELLIVFPLELALLRNLTRPECEASITRLYGNRKWYEIRQIRRDDKIELSDVRHRLVGLFKAGLKGLGYRYVESFKPAQFAPPFYQLILTSDNDAGVITLKDAWDKPRYLPCELLYKVKKVKLA
ncbi:three-Cys-motif partner protein TcmP [Chloroflexota bacterium]